MSTTELKLLPDALSHIDEAREALPDATIVIVDHPPDVCCRIGYDVALVPGASVPAGGFQLVGEVRGLPVLVQETVAPAGAPCITLGVDGETGNLVAVLEG